MRGKFIPKPKRVACSYGIPIGVGVGNNLHNAMVKALYKRHYISDDEIKRWLSRYNGGGTLSMRVLKGRDKVCV